MKLKFRKNKSYREKWTTLGRCCHFRLLEIIKQRLIDVNSFRVSKLLYSWSALFKSTNNFGSVFPNHLDRWIYEDKFPTARIFSMEGEVFYRTTNRSTTRHFRDPKFKTSLPLYRNLSPERHLTDPCVLSCMILTYSMVQSSTWEAN